jgi:hypothetical protein
VRFLTKEEQVDLPVQACMLKRYNNLHMKCFSDHSPLHSRLHRTFFGMKDSYQFNILKTNVLEL